MSINNKYKFLTEHGYALNCVAIYIFYTLTRHLSWYLSTNFEVITNVASWFLPAGVRLSALLILERRYWPCIVLGEYTSVLALYFQVQQYDHFVYEILGGFSPIVIYMFGAYFYFKNNQTIDFTSVSRTLFLLIYIVVSAFCTAAILIIVLILDSSYFATQAPNVFFSYVLGDLVGILLVFPAAYVIHSMIAVDVGFDKWTVSVYGLVVTCIAFLLLELLASNTHLVYYIKLFAIVPIIWCSYKGGWFGALTSTFLVNVFIVLVHMVTADYDDMLEKQFYIIVLSVTGMLLGSAISEKKGIGDQLAVTNEKLLSISIKLAELVKKDRQFAQSIVDVQESERKAIARELHDEIGQNITALKTNLKLLGDKPELAANRDLIDAIDAIADITYESAYDLMHWLRPRELNDLGLVSSLQSKKFEHLLCKAGITYITEVVGDERPLPERVSIAIYRIAQECINNSIKHSKADTLRLTLQFERDLLKLEIVDTGIGFDTLETTSDSRGSGLSGIEDRVVALGGGHQLNSGKDGTFHTVVVPIT